MAVQGKIEDLLAPYLEAGGPDEKGEWPMHCLVHTDNKRSASVNFKLGVWFCHACYRGGGIDELVHIASQKDPDFIPSGGEQKRDRNGESSGGAPIVALPSSATIAGWHAALMDNKRALGDFRSARGLGIDIIKFYSIGCRAIRTKWIYTLPIYDSDMVLLNVRYYDLTPGSDRRKIWGTPGHNAPTLFPIEQLAHDKITICEGEWDALVSIQNGIPAITRTGAAKVWKRQWNEEFRDKVVYLCHDMDKDGQLANRKVSRDLRTTASSVAIVRLPYRVTDKHGKDLTDFFHHDGHTADEFWQLCTAAETTRGPELKQVDLVDTFSAQRHGTATLSTVVNINSVHKPVYTAPKKIELRCGQEAGKPCTLCPMNSAGGSADVNIQPDDQSILGMIQVDDLKLRQTILKSQSIPKCPFLSVETVDWWDVSHLIVRSSVEQASVSRPETRAVTVVGPYTNNPNTVLQIVGNIYPDPRNQANVFQVSRSVPAMTSLDNFQLTPALRQRLSIFRAAPDQTPLEKAYDIADDISQHVTHIYGRPEMHVLMDLVFHSALAFYFAGSLEPRGWLDTLIIGDTRTGKSEAASSLVAYYKAGEMVNCEGASFAGVLGGVQKLVGDSWDITWGVIPQNDRRLVVLDEASALTPDEFAQLSGVRSSGEAQLTKIQAAKSMARTRLLWLANPRPIQQRSTRMEDFTYGVQAIQPLIVNPEDIARFDLAFSVRSDEVDSATINRLHNVSEQQYSAELSSALVLWGWSRSAAQIVWTRGAVAATYRAALRLGNTYVENPPLIQRANARMKIARIATALAIRTFSTDEGGENVIVRSSHVDGAVRFIHHLYGSPGFGYLALSQISYKDRQVAIRSIQDAKEFVYSEAGLAHLLFSSGRSFRGNDLVEVLSITKDHADSIVRQLANYRMIERGGPQNIISPVLRDIVRELVEM